DLIRTPSIPRVTGSSWEEAPGTMKRAWEVPEDVRTVHLGAFTPDHGAEIAQQLDDAGIAYWGKTPSGFFTRLWERDVHLFVDRAKLDEARELARRVIDPEGTLGPAEPP
ncbi:MAG: hypothetical protein OEV60_13345, partial [Actinomycetota bacterium]|nr:hypothetical protein [Actinomycetota bacterium]